MTVAVGAGGPVPFTVIGGFLGAGKTTLVNHILTHSEGVRYALLVNDFGRVNIDEQLVASHDGQTMALSNGCICCSLADGFVKTMLLLMNQIDRFDHIVVETSGVAEPYKIMDFARLDPMLYPEGIVVLADAAEVTDRVQDPQIETVVRSQLACASLLLLNKIDTVDAAQIERAEALLTTLNDRAPVLHCSNARVPNSLLFGHPLQADAREVTAIAHEEIANHSDADGTESAGARSSKAQSSKAQSSKARSTNEQPDTNPRITADSASPFTSHSVACDLPLDRDRFELFRAQLPSAVLRAKGVFQFAGDGGYYLWQRTGKRDELVPWKGTPSRSSQLVFIARAGADECAPIVQQAEALFAQSAATQ